MLLKPSFVKTVMISGLTKGVARYNDLIKQVYGVVFIATPHNGAELANLAKAVKFLLRTNEQVGDLTLHNAHLRSLHQQFLARYNEFPFSVRTFEERNPVSLDKGFFGNLISKVVVDPASSEPHVPNEIAIPLAENHFSICKPKSRDAQIHKSLIAFIQEVKKKVPQQEITNRLENKTQIKSEVKAMQSLIDLMQEKLVHLEKAFVLETNASVKFQLKNEIAELQQEIEKKKR